MYKHSAFTLLCVLAVFGSHCQMAPAAAGGSRYFEPGTGNVYTLESTLLLNEASGPRQGKDVGFHVSAKLKIETVWQKPGTNNDKLLRLELISPQLHIKSRKAPAPEGFVTHASKLENLNNGPFLLHWVNGKITAIYLDQQEEISLSNLKKGISSLFQFDVLDQERKETDASGFCIATYKTLGPHTIRKIKYNCKSDAPLPYINHPDKIWGATVKSERNALITLSGDHSTIESILSEETHELRLAAREEAGGSVTGRQKINLSERLNDAPVNKEDSLEAVVKSIGSSTGQNFIKQTLITIREPVTCQDGACPKLYKLVKENRENLQNKNLGTIRSASSFVKLLPAAREATREEISKVLKQQKNRDILPQIYDLLGAAQTVDAHQGALSYLKLDYDDYLDFNERYFWALSFGSHPDPKIIKDVQRIVESRPKNEKLFETVVLTLAAMTNRLRRLPGNSKHKAIEQTRSILSKGLSQCSVSNEDCKLIYLRAFKNLGSEESIPDLLGIALNGSRRVSVAAMKAIRSFPKSAWNEKVLKAAEKIYYQIGKRYDSSARTLALDILLESTPSIQSVQNLMMSLKTSDPVYEVKQYLIQRLRQVGERDNALSSKVNSIIRSENLNNYHILGQRGLSTAFTRSFMRHPSANGSLSTIQEISSGIVKRGLVDIIIEKDNSTESIFTLGLFAGGLSSFVSSDENTTPSDESEEAATAGMELTVMGVQIRPFVFFNGQGELMGHVWSGTGSEKTPAFQALGLMQDHLEYIPLELGYIAELSLLGGVSFDLSGQITLSLWNRNAESLVEKNAGVSVSGHIRVNSLFVHSQVQFNIATEVKLMLVSNIDFYNNIAMCLQLQQPNSIVKHNIHKVERIPGSKHRLRKSKYKVIPVAGTTYALNQKNNEMCNVIFKGHREQGSSKKNIGLIKLNFTDD